MEDLIFCISMTFISIPFIYPPTHKILRNRKTYNLIMLLSILLFLLSIINLNKNNSDIENHNSFFSLCPLFFLLLYKYYDNLILKKQNRHFYFYNRFGDLYGDEESEESTSLEVWLQMSLFVIPIVLSGLLSHLVFK